MCRLCGSSKSFLIIRAHLLILDDRHGQHGQVTARLAVLREPATGQSWRVDSVELTSQLIDVTHPEKQIQTAGGFATRVVLRWFQAYGSAHSLNGEDPWYSVR